MNELKEKRVDAVWVFHGAQSRYSNAVFSNKNLAEEWILKNGLTGMLTWYPINISVYDWSIQAGAFTPEKEYQTEPQFIQKFSSASAEHYHYEDGVGE